MSSQTSPTPLVVTIDGPAGAGKSTVARRVAERLGLDFLDTGAMYRGVAASALDCGMDPEDTHAVGELARRLDVRFDWKADPPTLQIDGAPVIERLRDADVTSAVSAVAANSAVRAVMVAQQQRIGREHPRLVTEGRDQGSVVFPGAAMKFYLDASAEVRASRRAEQWREAGREADEQLILEQIIERDRRDEQRPDGPLVCPSDAQRIDTSAMTLGQVIDLLTDRVRAAVEWL